MTIDDLREDFKVTYQRYLESRDLYLRSRGHPGSSGPFSTMREAHTTLVSLSERAYYGEYAQTLKLATRRFVRAGDLYYHAKKHGIESAVLYKLSLEL